MKGTVCRRAVPRRRFRRRPFRDDVGDVRSGEASSAFLRGDVAVEVVADNDDDNDDDDADEQKEDEEVVDDDDDDNDGRGGHCDAADVVDADDGEKREAPSRPRPHPRLC